MFTVDPSITDLHLRERNLLKAYFSMNNHQVATPEMMLEEARSYILFVREPDGRLSAYIGLYLLTTDRRLYYSHASNPFPFPALHDIEEEALAFVEGLGAMLDEIDFTKLPVELRNKWIDKQEMFGVAAAESEAEEVEAEVHEEEVVHEETAAHEEIGVDEETAAQEEEVEIEAEVQIVEAEAEPEPEHEPKRPAAAKPAASPALPGVSVHREPVRESPKPVQHPQPAPALRPADPAHRFEVVPEYPPESPKIPAAALKPAPVQRKPEVAKKPVPAAAIKRKEPVPAEQRETPAVPEREREALARLLSSF
jgi:hypothetical protein